MPPFFVHRASKSFCASLLEEPSAHPSGISPALIPHSPPCGCPASAPPRSKRPRSGLPSLRNPAPGETSRTCRTAPPRSPPAPAFPVLPHRRGVRRPVLKPEAQESHERQPVPDLVLEPLVGQIVQCTQTTGLEHQHRVPRLAPGRRLRSLFGLRHPSPALAGNPPRAPEVVNHCQVPAPLRLKLSPPTSAATSAKLNCPGPCACVLRTRCSRGLSAAELFQYRFEAAPSGHLSTRYN